MGYLIKIPPSNDKNANKATHINIKDDPSLAEGVFISPIDYWVGMKTVEQVTFKTEDGKYDFVLYDFRKWLRLTINCNPNVIETLFVDINNYNTVFNNSGRCYFDNSGWCFFGKEFKTNSISAAIIFGQRF